MFYAPHMYSTQARGRARAHTHTYTLTYMHTYIHTHITLRYLSLVVLRT